MDTGLRVTVLGEVSASLHGRPLQLGGRRQRAVLALLVIGRGGVVTTDRLIEALWSDAPPSGAVGSLQAYVSRLRRQLEPEQAARARSGFIVSEGGGYALRLPEGAVDAWRFERAVARDAAHAGPARTQSALGEALALWRGPAFAEYEAEPWAETEAARLAELREVARERLLASQLDHAESALLVPELEALVAEDPLREERWRLLALALYRSHRQADALSTLRRARRALDRELGVGPGSALLALEADVLAHSPALEAQRQPAAPAGELVDRERELAELGAILASDGSGAVFVEGQEGIGKTRLLTEARRLAAGRGALVLTARGARHEKEHAFGVVRQLLNHVAAEQGAQLLGTAVLSDARADGPGAGRPEGFAVLQALQRLVAGLAERRPLVLAVDDLQWCDTGSLHFLAYLAHRADSVRVRLVATVRTGEPHDDDTEELLAELLHDPAAVHLTPAPLTPRGVAALVRERLGDDADGAFTAACHRMTSGNPLLLRQLLRALADRGVPPHADHVTVVTEVGSRAVCGLVLGRLARLSPVSTDVARAVAVLGDGAALPAVAALLGRGESETADAIAPLVRAEVIADRYPLGFVHPLVADAVYQDLPPAERRLRHERAAVVLAEAGAPAERIAAHLLLMPRRGAPWVVDTLRSAATTAAGRGAADTARTYLTRALEEPPAPAARSAVLLELGLTESATDGPAAVRHLRESYETDEDPARRAITARILAGLLVFAGDRGEATAFARRAAAALPGELADERQALTALERVSGCLHGVDPRTWRTGPDPAVVGSGPGARMLAAALAWEAFAHRPGSGRAEAVRLARFALEGDTRPVVGGELLWATAGRVLHLADENADEVWAESLAFAREHGSVLVTLVSQLWRGYTQWCQGDLTGALESLGVADEKSGSWGAGSRLPHAFAVGVLLDVGDLPAARRRFDRFVRRPAAASGPRTPYAEAQAQAGLLIAEERFAQALRVLDDVAPVRPAARVGWWPSGPLRAQALAGLGRTAEAVGELEKELALARGWGAPSLIARTLRVLADVRGPGPASPAALREAEALLAPGLADLELVRVRRALAARLPSAEARPLLRRARELADRCGAVGLCRDIDADLEPLSGLARGR